MTKIDKQTQTELEAAAFRALPGFAQEAAAIKGFEFGNDAGLQPLKEVQDGLAVYAAAHAVSSVFLSSARRK